MFTNNFYFNKLPKTVQTQICSYLEARDFLKAKQLYDQFRIQSHPKQ